MATPTLNDFCHDNAFSLRLTSNLLSTPEDSAVQQRRTAAALEEESREINWTNLTLEEIVGLFKVVKFYRFTAALPWTPPQESADRPFKFRSFSRVATS